MQLSEEFLHFALHFVDWVDQTIWFTGGTYGNQGNKSQVAPDTDPILTGEAIWAGEGGKWFHILVPNIAQSLLHFLFINSGLW